MYDEISSAAARYSRTRMLSISIERQRRMSNSYYILTNLLTDDERRVVTSIVRHLEAGGSKVGIQQIANENYVSTAFIMKLCKRLGFAGYSELYYSLAQSSSEEHRSAEADPLRRLIDNYSPEQAEQFRKLLLKYKDCKLFVVGAGFAEDVANYIVKRLAICGFMVFNHVHFYDYMLFRQDASCQFTSNVESSLILAISQSGESEAIINDVREARQKGFEAVCFTRRADSQLARMSDLTFLVDASQQTLISAVPNQFFGKVILAFEELMGPLFR